MRIPTGRTALSAVEPVRKVGSLNIRAVYRESAGNYGRPASGLVVWPPTQVLQDSETVRKVR
jgi:hypothetical protein